MMSCAFFLGLYYYMTDFIFAFISSFCWHLCCLFLSLQAFAWWSDLMVEHAETFLSLYAVDMDAALEVQPPDSWDSFPLFQLLNDFLRIDCKYFYYFYALLNEYSRLNTRSFLLAASHRLADTFFLD